MHHRRALRVVLQPCFWLARSIRRRTNSTLIFSTVCFSLITFFIASRTFSETELESEEYMDKVARTAACKLPNINPFHESILPYVKELEKLDCGTTQSSFENSVLRVNGENIVSVIYRLISRPEGNDDAVNISEAFDVPNSLKGKATGEMQKGPIKPGAYGCIVHKLSGKCVHPQGGRGLPNGLQPVVLYKECCSKQSYFRVLPTGAVQHVQSGRCLRQKRPNTRNTDITLHQKCETLFTTENGILRETGTGMCLTPASERDDPANNEEIALGEDCNQERNKFFFYFKEGVPFKAEVPIHTDFIRVEIENGGPVDDNIETFMQTAKKDDVIKRRVQPAGIPVNILMIMFDSTSAANFHRKMPNTTNLLKNTLDTVFLRGQTIVGDGTTAQLSAILTGIAEKNQPEARKGRKKATTVDKWRWIFKDFKDRGYVTMYSEDSPTTAAFNFRLKGFRDPPTDHYSRYYWMEAENYIRKEFCSNNQAMHNMTFNYLLSLFRTYTKNPKFAMVNFCTLVHREPNAIGHADRDLYNLLLKMKKESFLDSTVVMIFGDHGYRFGGMRKQTLQGKLEERLPHFSITLPPWFRRKHWNMYKNLKFNSRILTSPFDIYATLKHIISYPWRPSGVNIGQSLFDKLDPSYRRCTNAGVRDHWCPCLIMNKVPVKNIIVQDIAQVAVAAINRLLNETQESRDMCTGLTLKEVKSASRELPSQVVQTFKYSFPNRECDSCGVKLAAPAKNTMVKDTLYQIKFVTSPNSAYYEASISLNGGVPSIDGDISRIDAIGEQADCVKESLSHLIKFCFCKGNKPIADDRPKRENSKTISPNTENIEDY